MNQERIDRCIFSGKRIASPIELWKCTKLGNFPEGSDLRPPRVIRVDFAGSRDEQIFVRRHSRDELRSGVCNQ